VGAAVAEIKECKVISKRAKLLAIRSMFNEEMMNSQLADIDGDDCFDVYKLLAGEYDEED
jgi:hypothetical protein